jgi:hypothetical protein
MLTACFILVFFVASSPLSYASDEEEPVSPQRRTTSNYSPFSPGPTSPLGEAKSPLGEAIRNQLSVSRTGYVPRIGPVKFPRLFNIKELLDEEASKLDQNGPVRSHSSSPLADEDENSTAMPSSFPNPSEDQTTRSESPSLIPGQSEPMPMPYPLSLPQHFQQELNEIKAIQARIEELLARTRPSPHN